jgi:hypothetical protein
MNPLSKRGLLTPASGLLGLACTLLLVAVAAFGPEAAAQPAPAAPAAGEAAPADGAAAPADGAAAPADGAAAPADGAAPAEGAAAEGANDTGSAEAAAPVEEEVVEEEVVPEPEPESIWSFGLASSLIALLLGGFSAVLGIWVDRDKSRPVVFAFSMSVLISSAIGVGIFQSILDAEGAIQAKEDLRRMLSMVEEIARKSGDPKLIEMLKSEGVATDAEPAAPEAAAPAEGEAPAPAEGAAPAENTPAGGTPAPK